MQIEQLKQLIEEGLPGSQVDLHGDGTHFEAVIVSDAFRGKNMVQQHQIVYRCLGDRVGTEIHALSMQTYTPEQWESRSQLRTL